MRPYAILILLVILLLVGAALSRKPVKRARHNHLYRARKHKPQKKHYKKDLYQDFDVEPVVLGGPAARPRPKPKPKQTGTPGAPTPTTSATLEPSPTTRIALT